MIGARVPGRSIALRRMFIKMMEDHYMWEPGPGGNVWTAAFKSQEQQAAKRSRKLFEGLQYVPRVIITHKFKINVQQG